MISDIRAKKASRESLENECTKYELSFTWSDTNADLCIKINKFKGL